MLGHGGICITSNNQVIEGTWRWDREGISRGCEVSGERETVSGEKVTPPGETLIWLFLQVGLALYLGDMMKTMVGASKKLEATLAMSGHPNAFPSEPKATTLEWDLLQTFDYRTLLCTQVLKGNAAVWQGAVTDITGEVPDVRGLIIFW